MNARTSTFVSLFAAALGAAVLGMTPSAHACGGEWVPAVEIDHRIQGVASAEKAYDKGKALAAAASVVRMMPHIMTLEPKKSTLVARGQRILAMALARSNGALDIEAEVPAYARGTFVGKTDAERQTNLTWAVSALRKLAALKKDDAAVQSDLGEALARIPGNEAEARKLLEDLAKRDLLTTPEAYASLARLRAGAGDTKGERAAQARCEAMAKSPAVCGSAATAARS